jgi:hypothetical protein
MRMGKFTSGQSIPKLTHHGELSGFLPLIMADTAFSFSPNLPLETSLAKGTPSTATMVSPCLTPASAAGPLPLALRSSSNGKSACCRQDRRNNFGLESKHTRNTCISAKEHLFVEQMVRGGSGQWSCVTCEQRPFARRGDPGLACLSRSPPRSQHPPHQELQHSHLHRTNSSPTSVRAPGYNPRAGMRCRSWRLWHC